MNAYAYQAALYCDSCGPAIKNRICGENLGLCDRGDSDAFPQGPFPDGGGEADCPQHCDSCGVFLENPLTDDGDSYVRAAAEQFDAPDSSWDEIAERAENAGHAVLAEWVRFYLAWGQ